MALAAGNNDGDTNRTAVFITTSLDTRLVTTVSISDTVSDFKKKIMLEHLQCFPAIGNIIVHSLKVKRRGTFYHLSDLMLVKSAFGTKNGNLFLSADASSLEQYNTIQHFDKHKVGNELALPWVTQKTVPFENQIVSNVDGDSCKDISKNLEEGMLSDDKQLAISKDLNSKKRTRDVNNENLLNDPSECGLPAKKKRKTQRVKSNVKASEENIILTNDDDNVKDRGGSLNNENTFEHKSKDNDLVGEKRDDHDQVADVVHSSLEGVGREIVADVAMVAEENINHGMCEKEKEYELVQKTVMENEIPSLARTSDCSHDAAGLTVVAPVKRGSKRSTKHKTAKKEVSSTSFINELHNINEAAAYSSQQDRGSNGQGSGGDLIDKHKEDIEFSLKEEPEVKLPERRKRVKKSAAKSKNETLVTPTRADDNLVGDVISTVLAPISDEKFVVRNEVLETALVDDVKKNDEMLVKTEVSEPTKSHRNRGRVDNIEENSKNKLKDRSRRRKKDAEKTGLKNDETVVKQSNDVATSMDALHVDCVRNDDVLIYNDAELLRTEKNLTEVKVEDIDGTSEKQNGKMDVLKKSTRKKKTKKSASRNEDESITKHDKVEIPDTVKEGPPDRLIEHQSTEVELESKKSQSIDHEDISKNVTVSEVSKVDNNVEDEEKKSSLTVPQDQLSKLQSTEVELESKKSQSIDHCHDLEDTSKNVTVAEVSKVNDEVDITNDSSHEPNFVDHFAPGDQPNTIVSIDNQKVTKKPKKKTKDGSVIDGGDIQSQKILSKNEGSVKAKKNSKSSLASPQDQLSKLQSTEVDLESKKSQSIDHHRDPEDTFKNMTGSEASKANNEAGSREINFMDYFAPGHQPNKSVSIDNGKDTKKPKKLISKNKNNKVVTGPNIPKTTRNIDAESSSSSQSFCISFHHNKSNKQQSVVGPVKKVLPVVHNWLKTPAKIFGDDSDKSSADDNATVNSDSSTQTPSIKRSSSSSSSGDSATSLYLRRNRSYAMKRKEAGGKNSMMSQSKLKKNMSMSDLLRSSSRFKKAKITASQMEDTESQPVDFVPDSQPLA